MVEHVYQGSEKYCITVTYLNFRDNERAVKERIEFVL